MVLPMVRMSSRGQASQPKSPGFGGLGLSQLSVPASPLVVLVPAPPWTASGPAPAQMMSLPPPPSMVSGPPKPKMMSSPAVGLGPKVELKAGVITLGPLVPTMAFGGGGPAQTAPWPPHGADEKVAAPVSAIV